MADMNRAAGTGPTRSENAGSDGSAMAHTAGSAMAGASGSALADANELSASPRASGPTSAGTEPHRSLRIDGARLWQSLMQLAEIGATAKGGVRRLALTDLDRQGRDLVVGWFRDAGCNIQIDGAGNIFAIRGGRADGQAVVLSGSHIDTQPSGGKFDGNYGVLAGLEVLRTLNDSAVVTRKPVGVAVWTNEEGSRFVPVMGGSGAFAGVFPLHHLLQQRDAQGVSFGDALTAIGYAGALSMGAIPVDAYFEAHIEQGPILEREDKTIGVVTGALGQRWYDCVWTGQDAHAGPTPMEARKDALLGAARLVDAVNALALRHAPDGRATVGCLQVSPNSRNVVPGRVTMTVDMRHPDDDALLKMDAELRHAAAAIAGKLGLECDLRQVDQFPSSRFDAPCVDAVRTGARELGLSSREIVSGAAHDAIYVGRVAPAAMIFVPCKDGISHNEVEDARPEHLEAGANVLLQAVLTRAGVAEDGRGHVDVALAARSRSRRTELTMRIVVMPGDGIGPEIAEATLDVLKVVSTRFGLDLEFDMHEIGFASLRRIGSTFPDVVLDACRKADGIVLGPIGHATYPSRAEGGINVSGEIRRQLDLYANIRPARSRPGLQHWGRTTMDLVIVRENTEGFYADRNMYEGIGEFMPDRDMALSIRKVTAKASRRIATVAFELARKRRSKVTAVHKANVLKVSEGLFLREVRAVAANVTGVAYDEQLVDSMSALLVRDAQRFDVVLTTNMFGDILSDEAAELCGSLGLAGAVNAGDAHCIAQAQHGSAPDIAGQDKANPTSLILSAAMLLEWLSIRHAKPAFAAAHAAIEAAVDSVLQQPGLRTRDVGGNSGTRAFAQAICRELAT